jgi:hypothetical protein
MTGFGVFEKGDSARTRIAAKNVPKPSRTAWAVQDQARPGAEQE